MSQVHKSKTISLAARGPCFLDKALINQLMVLLVTLLTLKYDRFLVSTVRLVLYVTTMGIFDEWKWI